MAKSTKAEVIRRIGEVYVKLLHGWPRSDIIQYAKENWDIREDQVNSYLKRARKRIKQDVEDYTRNALEDHISKRMDLYRNSLDDGDSRLALEVIKDLGKLSGVYPTVKQEVTSRNLDINLSELNEDQLLALADGKDISEVLAMK